MVFRAYANAATTQMLVDNINITSGSVATPDVARFDLLNIPPVAAPPPPVITGDTGIFDNVNLQPAAPPATPTSLVAMPLDGGAAISWSEGTPARTVDRVHPCGPPPVASTTSYAVASSLTTTQISGLTNGSVYTITLVANSINGSSGVATTTVTPASGTGTPINPPPPLPSVPDAPQLIGVTAGNQAAAASWTVPNNGGSAITGYRLTATDPLNQVITVVLGPAARSGTVGPLVNGTIYTITVVATNANGNSVNSNSLLITPSTATGTIPPAPPPDPPTKMSR